ncbi:MAG: hypothetical protein HOK06_03120 [Rhodospirillaceae bacterium]|nr:hypothetical protein [Rhodospirillaceae bacterium]
MTSNPYATGLSLMADNRFAEAEPCFAEQLANGPADDDGIRLYYLSLLYQGKHRTVIEHVCGQIDIEQSTRVLHDLMMRSILAGQRNFIDGLHTATSEDDPRTRAITCYWKGCLAHLDNHKLNIDTYFEDARAQAFKCDGLAMDDAARESILAAGNVSLQDFQKIVREGTDTATDIRTIVKPGDDVANEHDFVFFMSADGGYTDTYAEEALGAIARAGANSTTPYACHLHLIGADDAAIERVRDLASRTPGVILTVTSEPDPPTDAAFNRYTYYACNRFIQAAEIIKRHDRDLLIIDIDDFIKDNVGDMTTAARNYDVCFFQNPSPTPQVVCSAAAVYVTNNAQGRSFLDGMSRYIAKRLAEGGRWMLDQAALYCALKVLGRPEGPIGFGDFSQILEASLRDYLTESDKTDAKNNRNAGRFG